VGYDGPARRRIGDRSLEREQATVEPRPELIHERLDPLVHIDRDDDHRQRL